MSTNFFDIETETLADDRLALVKPVFDAPSNYKDAAKIAEHIAIQEAEWKNRGALSAVTGRVLCVGVMSADFMVLEGDEGAILIRFWAWLAQLLHRSDSLVGFNIYGFDLPFLMRRSWVLGVKVPPTLRSGRYWNRDLVDLMDVWTCGNRDQRISLDTLAKTLGVGSKNGDGKDFAKLYAEDKEKAFAYLRNDLELTRLCWERLTP